MKRKRVLLAFLCLACIASLLIGNVAAIAEKDQDVDSIISGMKSEYKVGTEIAVPDAFFNIGGTQVKADKTVVYPDGSQYRMDRFTPTVAGEYIVEYSKLFGEEYLVRSKSICVNGDLYSIDKEGGTVYYGSNPLTPNTSGLNVGLKFGQVFSYNQPIDLEALGNNPFISLYLAPERMREAEAEDFFILLTDAYDATNTVRIRVRSTPNAAGFRSYTSYISAGASFQPLVGYEGIKKKVHTNTNYGFDQAFTFYGCDTSGAPSEPIITSSSKNGQLSLYFDVSENKIKTQGNLGGFNEVTDLDDPKYYTDLWSGFTAGKVFLSIYSNSVFIDKERLNIVITQIAGNNLKENKCIDDELPIIMVDLPQSEELPHALVGKPYPVKSAAVLDAYGNIRKSGVAVYRNYKSPSQTSTSIVNGSFTPTNTGRYFIVYTATDYFGNTQELVFSVICDAAGEKIALEVDETQIVRSVSVGDYVRLPDAVSYGGNGETSIRASVVDEKGVNAEINDGAFTPTGAGKYRVTYTASDFIGQEMTYTYEMTASISEKPVFFGKSPEFDTIFIAGYEYTLPEYKAFDYARGGEEVSVTVKITDDSGEKTLNADRKATFSVKTAGDEKTVTIRYEAKNASGTTVKEFTATALSAKQLIDGNQRLDTSKYFYSADNVRFTADDSAVKFTASADGDVSFINDLLASSFSFSFSFAGTDALGAFKITLTDAADPAVVAEFLLKRGEEQNTICIVNAAEHPENIPISYENGTFSLSYNEITHLFSFDDNGNIGVRGFSGFPSGKLRLTFGFVGVRGESAVKVDRLNAQSFSRNVVLDRVSPRISLKNEYKTQMMNVGDIVTVCAADAADVLDPSVRPTVTVKGPDGKPIASLDGQTMQKLDAGTEYRFKIERNGSYSIVYEAVDSSDNRLSTTRFIKALDTEAPVITLTRRNIESAAKDSVVVVAPITVSDNQTATEEIYSVCFVIRPNGYMIKIDLKECNSFVANETGKYIIRYMAFDSETNVSILENELNVA